MSAPETIAANESDSGLVRMMAVAFRRYSRDPATRKQAARLMLIAAVELYAEQTSAGDAALTASEALAELARRDRRSRT